MIIYITVEIYYLYLCVTFSPLFHLPLSCYSTLPFFLHFFLLPFFTSSFLFSFLFSSETKRQEFFNLFKNKIQNRLFFTKNVFYFITCTYRKSYFSRRKLVKHSLKQRNPERKISGKSTEGFKIRVKKVYFLQTFELD